MQRFSKQLFYSQLKMPSKLLKVSATAPSLVMRYQPKSTFSLDPELPSLPVPPLEQTMQKYITALEPILFDSEYEQTKRVVADFQKPGGIGETLQKKLQEKAASSDNWLATWWDNCAYFGYRAPVVINSSPGVAFPLENFKSDVDQLRYAANLIRTIVSFKESVDNQTLSIDYAGQSPLSMRQYGKLLSICRIPCAQLDGEVMTPPEESRHVIVTHNNHFFKLDVYEPGTNNLLSEGQLIHQLNHIVNESRFEDDLSVGILTAEDRNVWAQGYKRLTRDSKNRDNVDKIVKSICLICLDKPINVPEFNEGRFQSSERSQALHQMLHGGGSEQNSMNRWFDKICQFVVNRNGMVGLTYEHSGAEGPPVLRLCNSIMDMSYDRGSSIEVPTQINAPAPEMLSWNLDYDLVDRIELAKLKINQMSSDLDLRSFHFDLFGKNVPKKYKISPDAFFQVSLQLAYYRLHSYHPPTYESASIRKFSKGRTETIRSATPAAARYAREMDRSNYNDAEKKNLFLKAIDAHVQYTKDATNFEAIDRHLLGLKLTALENSIPLPEIFRDKAFGYATHFRLSTSQVPAKKEALLCFGPVVPDGYGVCYNPMESRFVYAVSSYNSHPKTHAGDLGECLAKALEDNHVLLASQSKL